MRENNAVRELRTLTREAATEVQHLEDILEELSELRDGLREFAEDSDTFLRRVRRRGLRSESDESTFNELVEDWNALCDLREELNQKLATEPSTEDASDKSRQTESRTSRRRNRTDD